METTTLDNGLAVTTVALPHLHTAVCALFVKVGARFEAPEDNGLSHFVEHMLFRGTERYATSLALNTAVELTSAAVSQMSVSGGPDEQAIALRDAMRVLFPEAVALVSAARRGFMRET